MKLNKNEKNYLLITLFKSYIFQSAICSVIIVICTAVLHTGLTWILDRYVEHYYLIYRGLYVYMTALIIWVICIMCLTYKLLKKVVGYVYELQAATGRLFDKTGDYIELSPELSEIAVSGESLIQIKNLTAAVRLNNGDTLVTVNNASIELKRGNSYAIVGKSGSGKTSLISIIGLLNRSYKGEYLYDGVSVSALTDRELSMLRANNIGFVFQNYSLIKHLRVWENIELPLLYAKKNMDRKQRQEVIRNLLKSVGLEDKENDYPANLSGGEQQRVAIARALTVSPEAILCDEPTGALDKKTGQQIMELLLQIVRENNIMLLLVTHDSDIANTCDTIFEMDEGRLRCAKNDF